MLELKLPSRSVNKDEQASEQGARLVMTPKRRRLGELALVHALEREGTKYEVRSKQIRIGQVGQCRLCQQNEMMTVVGPMLGVNVRVVLQAGTYLSRT